MSDLEISFLSHLNEQQKRLYAGLKASELGYHGVSAVATELGMHPHTVRRGQAELSLPCNPAVVRVRQAGGGRKKKQKVSLK